MQVLDFAARLIEPAAIKAAGYGGIMIYVADSRPGANFGAKPATREYCDRVRAAGLTICSNYQYGKPNGSAPSDFTRGFDGGVLDARRAADLHERAGGPQDAPIFFSVDDDISLGEWNDSALQWFRGINSVLEVQRTGVYGSSLVCAWAIEDGVIGTSSSRGKFWAWQTKAWSGGEREGAAVLFQSVVDTASNPGPLVGGTRVDVNDVLAPDFGQWGFARAGTPVPPTPPPQEELPVVSRTGDPVWLADVLRAEGLVCDIMDGAFERGEGDFGVITHLLAHHTGSNPPSNNPGYIARHPSLGLASQLHLARDGKWTLCGVGIANHGGVGSWPGIAKNNINAVSIGTEAENNGTEGWSAVQYDSYVRGFGAILRALEYGSDRSLGHKEWAAIQGKWDPGGMDMNKFRRDVQAVIDRRPIVAIVNEINESARNNPWIGDRIRPEEITVGDDGAGRLGVFTHAHIYFHPTTGAFPIPHADPELGTDKSGLFEAYGAYDYERGILGYPVRGFTRLDGPTGKGAVQAFQGGVLYRKDGAERGYVVHGAIGIRWAAEGYEKGQLGWPISNETVDPNGNRVQVFENGSLYWHSTGVTKLTVS